MYTADTKRYGRVSYKRCGKSGLKLPVISLGLWHNFGSTVGVDTCKELLCKSFDYGITHFDLANNYGPVGGAAEENFGRVLKSALMPYRDELIISTKAGYTMWAGPYGDFGSKKYLVASLDQSLRRMGLDYVDIFYHHRPDPDTPMEETACALDLLVRQGKALYIGVSNYSAEQTAEIAKLFQQMHTPFIIHQPRYNMMDRWIEDGLTDVLKQEGLGSIVFSPLAQGLLTNRYLDGIPSDSRAANSFFLKPEYVEKTHSKIVALHNLAVSRGQTLAQMAIAWIMRNDAVTSVLVGASKISQIEDNLAAANNTAFTDAELAQIDQITLG